MSRRAQQSGGGLTDRLPLGRGAALGGVAYLAAYVVTYVFTELSQEETVQESGIEQYGAGQTDVVGWMFYSAHFADFSVSVDSGSRSQSESMNLLSEASDLAVPEPLWYLVPIAALAVAGYATATAVDGSHDATAAAKGGVTVVAGYLPLAAIGAFLFTKSGETTSLAGTVSYTIGPDKAMGIALAGVAYPVVLGAAGGFLTTVVGNTGASQPRGGRSRPGQSRQGNARGQQRQATQQRQGGQRGRQQQGGQRGRQQQGGQRGRQQRNPRGGQQGGDDSRSRE